MAGQTKTPPATSLTNFAEVLGKTRSSLASNEQVPNPIIDNLVSQSQLKPGYDSDEQRATMLAEQETAKEKLDLAREQHNKISPPQEKVHQLFAQQNLKDQQAIVLAQQELKAYRAKKEVPATQTPKILDAPVVNPGEQGNVFDGLMALARAQIDLLAEKAQVLIPQSPFKLAQGRESKRVTQTRKTQKNISDLDRNVVAVGA